MVKVVKQRKHQKCYVDGVATRRIQIHSGRYAIKAIGRGHLETRQIEAARVAIARKLKSFGGNLDSDGLNVWIPLVPNISVSAKPIEVRMGKGKGSIDHWVSRIRPGQILIEIGSIYDLPKRKMNLDRSDLKNKKKILEALKAAQNKFPMETRLCVKTM